MIDGARAALYQDDWPLTAKFYVGQQGELPAVDEVIGVWYDSGLAQWAIFNQSLADIPEGASFNVLVLSKRVFLPFVGRSWDG